MMRVIGWTSLATLAVLLPLSACDLSGPGFETEAERAQEAFDRAAAGACRDRATLMRNYIDVVCQDKRQRLHLLAPGSVEAIGFCQCERGDAGASGQ